MRMHSYPNEGARLLAVAKAVRGLTDGDIERIIGALLKVDQDELDNLSSADIERLIASAIVTDGPRGGSPSRYMNGKRDPERRVAVVINAAFGVPVESWGRRPTPRRARNHSDSVATPKRRKQPRSDVQVSR